MKLLLLTTKTCHCADVEHALGMLGLNYIRCDIEDQPELAQDFGIRHCPTLIVDDARAIPIDEGNITQLRELLLPDDRRDR